jgi:hypothetical protein
MTTTGHCLCGAVTWRYEGTESWACYCHCDSCRRNCAAPVTAYLGVPLDAFTWTGETPKTYRSSPGVRRHFCGTCGSPMAYEADRYSGEIHLYAASLDDPAKFEPEFHVHYADKLPWLYIADDLPKYQRMASGDPLP